MIASQQAGTEWGGCGYERRTGRPPSEKNRGGGMSRIKIYRGVKRKDKELST